MDNRDLFAAARFTRPERAESACWGFLYGVGLALTVCVIAAGLFL